MKPVFILAAALLASGCSTHVKQLPGLGLTQPLELAPLDRSDYQVLDTVEGHSCQQSIFLAPLPIYFRIGDPDVAVVPYAGTAGRAQASALAEALVLVPEADAVISPVWDLDRRSVLPWWTKTCATVRARAIHIKGEEKARASTQP